MLKSLGIITAAMLALASSRAVAADHVTIGILNGASSFIPLIADEKGYFKAEGIETEFVVFDSGAKMIPSLGTDQLQVGIGSASSGLYNAVARGIKLKIVADALRNSPGVGQSLMVRKDLIDDGKVRGLKDLKGMKFAVTAFASSEASSLDHAMRSVGLSFDDVEKLYLGFPEHVVAFQNKAIDAALTGEPFATVATNQGVAKALMTVGEYYPNQETAVVVYSGGFLKNTGNVGTRFLKAYLRAARDYIDARKDGYMAGPGADDIIAILAKRSSIKNPALIKQMRANGIDTNGELNITALKEDFKFFKDQKQIDGEVKVEDVLDPSFAEAVTKDLGRRAQ